MRELDKTFVLRELAQYIRTESITSDSYKSKSTTKTSEGTRWFVLCIRSCVQRKWSHLLAYALFWIFLCACCIVSLPGNVINWALHKMSSVLHRWASWLMQLTIRGGEGGERSNKGVKGLQGPGKERAGISKTWGHRQGGVARGMRVRQGGIMRSASAGRT